MEKCLIVAKNIETLATWITSNVEQFQTGPILQPWCAVPELPRYLVGFDLPLRELKSKLLNDDEISMLVLTGPGGCGKTTLATMLCRDAQVIDKFGDNIFFVTVSENPKLDLIINELYHRKGSTVPTFQNEASSVKWLHAFLKDIGTEPSLLVLDDVWSGSESLLDKFYEVKIQNVKIFVTSRSAFPGFGSSYNLGSLDNVQAMTLFHHSASMHNNSYHIPEDLVAKILDCCKGYPLAIKVVGRSLCGKPLEFWCKRETELSKGGSIVDFAPEALQCLRNSLDVLDEKEKERIDENVLILKEEETNVMREILGEHNADLVVEKEKNVMVREEEIVMVVAGEESNVVKKKNGVVNEKNVVVREEEAVIVVAEEERNVVKKKNDIRSWSKVYEHPPVIVGLDVPLRDLKRMLLDDGISRLVLTAPGGAGKTTLATELFRDEGIKGIFKNNMFFVVVSNKPSLELIVQQLYRQKGGQPVPKYLDHEVIAVHWLEKFLEEAGQKPFLLVLDDVWSGSELLDKFLKFKMSNYKFLVTSRYEFRNFGKSYYLKTLDDEDAMILFRDAACLGNELSIPKRFEAEILRTCKGFPITIQVLGRSIRGQSIEDMQKTVMKLSRGSILDSETEVLVCLQRSLDPLDKVTKDCFMDLGAFPEDKITSATILIDMWSELHGLDDEIMCVEILHKLSSRSLAKLDVTRYRCSSATILIDMWSELHGLDDEIMCVEILHKLSSRSLAKLDVTRYRCSSATILIDMWSELHGLDDEIMCVEILHKLSSRSLAKLDVTRYRCSSATILIDMWSELHGLDDEIMCVEILHKLSSRSLAKLDVTRYRCSSATILIDMWSELHGLDDEIMCVEILHKLSSRSLAKLDVTRYRCSSATILIDMWSELHGLDDEIMCVEILHKLSSQSLAKLDVTRYRCSSATILIDMWSELHGLDDQIMCVEILHKLSSRSLAKLDVTRKDTTEADGYYSEHFVTQHDVLRQLAIYQAKQEPIEQRTRLNITDTCGDNLPKWLIKQVHQPVKARLLSISSDGVFSTKWNTVRLPEVEVLLLNFEKIKNCLLPEFVEKLHELKVLIVTNYGPVPTVLSNFQLLGLLPSLKRIRLECISVPSITKNCPTQFRSLQKICFTRCDIGLAFSNMSIQISDAFPKLVEVSIEYCDLVTFPSELCDLVKLKKLSLIKCYKLSALPEEIGKLANLELLRLRSCIDLVGLPCSLQNLKSLNFLDIANCFSIKELPEHIGHMSSLRKINMVQCSGVEKLPLSVMNLEQLEEVICDGETSKLWEIYLDVLGDIIKLVPDL